MVRITQDDRKHASNVWTIVKRQAYGGNLLQAENVIARAMAEERARCAQKLDEIADSIKHEDAYAAGSRLALKEVARRLLGQDAGADEDRGCGEVGEAGAGREHADADQPDESHEHRAQ
jgi:hypothetical protein